MLRRRLVAITVIAGTSAAGSAAALAQTETGSASVNGLIMYYEVHGAGRPLVRLHGALMTNGGFGKMPKAK